ESQATARSPQGLALPQCQEARQHHWYQQDSIAVLDTIRMTSQRAASRGSRPISSHSSRSRAGVPIAARKPLTGARRHRMGRTLTRHDWWRYVTLRGGYEAVTIEAPNLKSGDEVGHYVVVHSNGVLEPVDRSADPVGPSGGAGTVYRAIYKRQQHR